MDNKLPVVEIMNRHERKFARITIHNKLLSIFAVKLEAKKNLIKGDAVWPH